MNGHRVILSLVASVILGANPAWAARTIFGTITDMSGKPAFGMLVKAWDEDDGSKNDLMGQAHTDSQGRYRIGPFEAKHWDPAPHGITTWRPDIFVEVHAKIQGRWVPVKQSGVHKDREHKNDTKIDLKLTGISGTIRDSDGKPAAGVLVKAWDEDGLLGVDAKGKHDFINETTTDTTGRYFMLYEGKHWDTAPHGVTTWRPDIFIEVYDTIRGRRIKVNKRSRIAHDQPHHENCNIDETIPSRSDVNYIAREQPDGRILNILTYNVYMRPTTLFKNGQRERVPFIAKEILRDPCDVLVLNEVFDDDVRKDLVKRLKTTYRYRSKILSGDPRKQDGGVKILSRWPIQNGEGEQRLFGTTCKGEDCLADKGVMYVQIDKKGVKYHIFGTHTQADTGIPGGQLASAKDVRKSQFRIIRKFIDDKNIDAGEAVVIAGDLNVDKHGHPGEYNEMLAILHADMPASLGHRYSIDEKLNDLGGNEQKQELLDYVLYSTSHKTPERGNTFSTPISFNRVMFYRSESQWPLLEPPTVSFRWDISDHYPVFGMLAFTKPTSAESLSEKPRTEKPVPLQRR